MAFDPGVQAFKLGCLALTIHSFLKFKGESFSLDLMSGPFASKELDSVRNERRTLSLPFFMFSKGRTLSFSMLSSLKIFLVRDDKDHFL